MDENWYAVEQEVREQIRKARVAMWRDPYLLEPHLQDALRREHIAEARRQALREHLLLRPAASRIRSRCWAVIQRLVQATATLRPRRRITWRGRPIIPGRDKTEMKGALR